MNYLRCLSKFLQYVYWLNEEVVIQSLSVEPKVQVMNLLRSGSAIAFSLTNAGDLETLITKKFQEKRVTQCLVDIYILHILMLSYSNA